MNVSVDECVDRGFASIVELLGVDAFDNVNLNTLDQASNRACVAVQVTFREYHLACKMLRAFSLGEAIRLGFESPDGSEESWDALTQAWRKRIIQLREPWTSAQSQHFIDTGIALTSRELHA